MYELSKMTLEQEEVRNQEYNESVSYTHLDVYKRQMY